MCCGSRPTWNVITTRRSSPCATARPRSRYGSSRCRWRGRSWAIGDTPARSRRTAKSRLIYDYDHVDPAPLARLSGELTRFGDVAPLLQKDDDQLCLIGPGDEVRLEFEAAELPALAPGWTRSFVLRSYGYCKDADPFTAGSDTVEPIPWRGMPAYPFDREVTRPRDPAYESYLRTYQTRAAGGEHPR